MPFILAITEAVTCSPSAELRDARATSSTPVGSVDRDGRECSPCCLNSSQVIAKSGTSGSRKTSRSRELLRVANFAKSRSLELHEVVNFAKSTMLILKLKLCHSASNILYLGSMRFYSCLRGLKQLCGEYVTVLML